LIANQELETGIYVANTISTSNDPNIRILSTHHTDKVVDAKNLKYEPFSNYDVVQPNKETRKQTVMSQLSKNFPPQFNNQLQMLCSNYTDIFGMTTEPISDNNLDKQRLRLKDDKPVYIKNYRNPHSQKDEVQEQVQK